MKVEVIDTKEFVIRLTQAEVSALRGACEANQLSWILAKLNSELRDVGA